ncbi:MAG: ATP-binding cassette domain-containing protein [bacterium]|nr:ATP-binding cassette domain-containing protein [bacterium]
MIEVKNVSKKFQKKINQKESISFLADNDISFTAKEGEIIGIIGPNGAGKTTLLRMIAGIMTPTSGQIIIDGKTHQKDSIEIKKNISFLTGNTKLYKDISPYELLKMCGEYHGIPKEDLEKRIDTIIKRFSMEAFKHQKIETLSTGQYQRTGISRCLVSNPKYYILDEPTSGLDVISSKVILDFIKEEKAKNKCILYSTHYMEEAENICDRIVMINKGQVIATGTPKEIRIKTNTTNLRDSFFALIGGQYEEK